VLGEVQKALNEAKAGSGGEGRIPIAPVPPSDRPEGGVLTLMSTRESPSTVEMVGRIRGDRSLGVRRASREEGARGAVTPPRRPSLPRRSTKQMDFRKWDGPSTGFSPRWYLGAAPLATTATVASGSLPQVGTEWVIPADELGHAPPWAWCSTSTSTPLVPNLSVRFADGHPFQGRRRDLRSSLSQPALQVW
jgi:hypothetical protein